MDLLLYGAHVIFNGSNVPFELFVDGGLFLTVLTYLTQKVVSFFIASDGVLIISIDHSGSFYQRFDVLDNLVLELLLCLFLVGLVFHRSGGDDVDLNVAGLRKLFLRLPLRAVSVAC